MSIDKPEHGRIVHALAEQANAETMSAVVVAVRDRIDRLQTRRDEDRRREELQALADRLASRFKEPYRSLDHGEWLYDENGLPR